ncbi:MAG: sugar phosphate isomerase/epimerase [Planctomycetota bacterium]|nr:sugar phosphate isomerase/epimerase [Planctomycetota bacterium]
MSIDRRRFVSSAALSGLGLALAESHAASAATNSSSVGSPHAAIDGYRFCLNTSTIREPKLGIEKEVDIASTAGYDAIEPWIPTLRDFVSSGGKLADLGKRISDAGLTVESAIGFAQWIADDDKRRTEALEEAKRDMDMLREIGGTRIAAPPVGAHQGDSEKIELQVVAERFRALQEVGDQTGVVPQLEVWGFSKNLSRLSDVMYVIGETGHPKACVLLDIYHLYKGGSDFAALRLLSEDAMQVFHVNDYPDVPPRDKINDADRVYTGDGIAPMSHILNSIGGHGRSIVLSLELFNREYWKQDPLEVSKTGLAKMKASVEKAIAESAATDKA